MSVKQNMYIFHGGHLNPTGLLKVSKHKILAAGFICYVFLCLIRFMCQSLIIYLSLTVSFGKLTSIHSKVRK